MRPKNVVASFFTLLLAAVAVAGPGSGQVAAASTLYSGRATVVDAMVAGSHVVLADTGPLPSSGGALEASLLQVNLSGLLTSEVLHAATVAQGGQSRSEASVADVALGVGGNNINADFLMARASASCDAGKASVSGSSTVVMLTINGQSIAVSGQANQSVPLPNGRVVINEQAAGTSASPHSGDLQVTALHIIVDGLADVAIAKAHADITCGGPTACDRDFVTGGGWITSGAKDTFAVAGGIRNGAFWGHLQYVDHARGTRVLGTGVTAYAAVGTTSRHIEGTAQVNGVSGYTYQVDVADTGEPGRNDTFALRLSNGYSASGTLGGGNIQLHTCR